MDLGIFIPIGNNGWMMSANAPQYMPSFELNRTVAERAEAAGFDFLLSMVKLRGFGGATQFWDHNLESFTLMAGLAAVTSEIELFASVALPTLHPAMVARMAATIDDISGGRFGINIVSGWNQSEYAQMNLWPGDWYYEKRYDYATEYVSIMRELWAEGVSNHRGDYFQMDDCRLSPPPRNGSVPLVCAGQSDRGMQFCAEQGDVQFIIGTDDFDVVRSDASRLLAASEVAGRDVGVYVLFQITMGETDAEAEQKWQHYRDGADLEAIAFMTGQASLDTAGATAEKITEMKGAFNLNIGPIVGSHATVAARLDEVGAIPGVKGVMCVFDDYPLATAEFGERVMPLLASRAS
ncbi:MAG: LLM class flavin-dependent oxidoreductase [Acidimicrobiales bacterium]